MGLDSYIDHSCAFRPDGGTDELTRILQYQQMVALMDQHGLPSITLRRSVGGRPVEQVIRRSDIEPEVRALQTLSRTCATCPAAVLTEINGSVPGCRARVSYPIDDLALDVIRAAMVHNAEQAESQEDLALIWSLVLAGDCDGSRMLAMLGRLEADPSPIGLAAVDYALNGRVVAVTPYMLLEHLCFRPSLNRAAQAALLRWFSFFYQAIGERIAAAGGSEPDPAGAVFGRSPALVGLSTLHKLVKRAHEQGWSIMLDG